MEFRVFLRGGEQSGMTALLIRALSDLRVISGGWTMVELEGGAMGLVEPCEAAAEKLPLPPTGTDIVDRFDRAIAEIREKDMGWLDPVLGPELADADIAARLEALFAEQLPVMGALCPREQSGDPAAWDRIVAKLEQDGETLLLDVSDMPEAEAVARLRDWAETVLDWAHHKKFDPLMKLRRKRRRTGISGA